MSGMKTGGAGEWMVKLLLSPPPVGSLLDCAQARNYCSDTNLCTLPVSPVGPVVSVVKHVKFAFGVLSETEHVEVELLRVALAATARRRWAWRRAPGPRGR